MNPTDYYRSKLARPGYGAVHSDSRRVEAIFQEKMKYKDAIKDGELPFLICIDMDVHTWLHGSEIYNFLYGRSYEIYDKSRNLSYSKCNLNEGRYNIEGDLKDLLSGVFLLLNGEFIYFHNYSKNNRLYNRALNVNLFLDYQHQPD